MLGPYSISLKYKHLPLSFCTMFVNDFFFTGIQVSQASTSQSSGANLNLSSVLKSSDKLAVQTAFAQLVHTSTGKHILFTPSCISTSSLGNLSGNTTGK